MKQTLLFLVSIVLAGCGGSGTWHDDPRNWQRAFGQSPPASITIVHSMYSLSPHFTHESEYFFELAPNASFQTVCTDPKAVTEISPDNDEEQTALRLALVAKPPWFAPKLIEEYQVFQGNETPHNYFVLIERKTGEIFLTNRIGM